MNTAMRKRDESGRDTTAGQVIRSTARQCERQPLQRRATADGCGVRRTDRVASRLVMAVKRLTAEEEEEEEEVRVGPAEEGGAVEAAPAAR